MPCPYADNPKAQLAYRISRLASISVGAQSIARRLAVEIDPAGQTNYQPGFQIPAGEIGDRIVIDLLAMARSEIDDMLESFTGTHPRDRR